MKHLIARARAFKLGLYDGLEQPYDLTCGMSYQDLVLQDAWDYGCNLGQCLGKLRGRLWTRK